MEAQDFIRYGSGTVTLCGSTRFFHEAMEANRLLTFENWIVLACGSWGHSYHKYAKHIDRSLEMLKRLHYHKIAASDLVVVVTDTTGYIGHSTKLEVAYASSLDIPVIYYDGQDFSGSTSKSPPIREIDPQIESLEI